MMIICYYCSSSSIIRLEIVDHEVIEDDIAANSLIRMVFGRLCHFLINLVPGMPFLNHILLSFSFSLSLYVYIKRGWGWIWEWEG